MTAAVLTLFPKRTRSPGAICKCGATLGYFDRHSCKRCRAAYMRDWRAAKALRMQGLLPASASAIISGFLAEAA